MRAGFGALTGLGQGQILAVVLLLVGGAMVVAPAVFSGPTPSPPMEGIVFVVNLGTQDMSVVNVSAEEEIERIPLGGEPHGISIVGDRLYVSNYLRNTSAVVSLPGFEKVDRIETGHMPHVTRRVPGEDRMYISSPHHGIYLYDVGARRVVDDFYTPLLTERMDMAADGDIYLVAPALKQNEFWRHHDTTRVAKSYPALLLVRNLSLVREERLSYDPHDVIVTDSSVYVSQRFGNKVMVHHPETLSLQDAITINEPVNDTVPGQVANEIAVDGRYLYVSSRLYGEVVKIDRRTHTIVDRFSVPSPQYAVPFEGRLYVASENEDALYVLDAESGETLKRIPVGEKPQEVVVYERRR